MGEHPKHSGRDTKDRIDFGSAETPLKVSPSRWGQWVPGCTYTLIFGRSESKNPGSQTWSSQGTVGNSYLFPEPLVSLPYDCHVTNIRFRGYSNIYKRYYRRAR